MGCCGSAPTAEEYLNLAQPECPDPLMPDLPRAMLMNPWPLQIGFASKTNDPAGHGSANTLSLANAEGVLLASINMPARRSFGTGASVIDAAGNPVAWLRSAEKSRPLGINKSSYHVFGARPQTQGQQPTALEDGTKGYLWATVTRAPFSSTQTVANGTGAQIFSGRTCMGFDTNGMQTYLLEAVGAGVCHISKTKAQPPMHDIRLAQGVDALLCVLIKLAAALGADEIEESSN